MKEKVFQWGNLFYFDEFQIEQYGSVRHLQYGKLNDAFVFTSWPKVFMKVPTLLKFVILLL